ncbi:hypothetical protein CDAR_24811 [Caerostris darwini]|uniref:Uncharacterized protein n=1 Tax=Caerostris darwini TaxID=1538125 RepID=A0AAV4PUB7_9ARAC|nr:hypothetical protein CDAR_24811 [Caerostris darwini]
MSIYAGVSSMMEVESHSGLMDPADDKFIKLIQEMDDFKNKFSPIPDARLSTGKGPHQDHLQVPSSGAAEAMITDSPILTEAEHCSHITAAQTQLKDREKAVDMMQQIIRHQGVLIDEGLMKPTALKPTLEGLKKAEDALAETTKRDGHRGAESEHFEYERCARTRRSKQAANFNFLSLKSKTKGTHAGTGMNLQVTFYVMSQLVDRVLPSLRCNDP